jgi:hypothetical protein
MSLWSGWPFSIFIIVEQKIKPLSGGKNTMNTFVKVALIAGFASMTVMGKNTKEKTVMLKVDYSGKQTCGYSVSYSSQGSFKQKDSTSMKSTSVHGALSFTNKQQKHLAVKIDSISVTSDFLKEDQREEIVQKLLKPEYSLSLDRGFPSIDSGAALPIEQYMEWDLIRQLAKLLPSLPDKSIPAGFTWERTVMLPLQTARGKTPCEIYRFYTLNKIQGDTAFISWKLTYTASKKAADSTDVLRHIPVAGKGNGSAILDVRNHCILGAEMDFATPVGTVGDISVTWTEKASLKLKSCK